jgi:transcriptional regulator with XRE-family HTH domain
MNIGKAIREIRKAKGLKQYQLAAAAMISTNSMVSIEKNGAQPHNETLRRICYALGLPVAYVVMYAIADEDMPENAPEELTEFLTKMKKAILA